MTDIYYILDARITDYMETDRTTRYRAIRTIGAEGLVLAEGFWKFWRIKEPLSSLSQV